MLSLWWLFLFCPIAYLVGNLNFSIIITKYILRKDIRKLGSGNAGASNVLRNFGFKWAITVLILEMIKATSATVMGMFVFGGVGYDFSFTGAITNAHGLIGMYACGISAIVGSIFPVTMKFKGGKGVSTTVGMFFVVNPVVTVAMIIAGIFIAHFSYAIISSFTFLAVLITWEVAVRPVPPSVKIMLGCLVLLIIYTHRKNWYRLFTGKENRAPVFKKKQKSVINDTPTP